MSSFTFLWRILLCLCLFSSLQAIANDVNSKIIGLNFSPYMDGQSPNWQTQISQTQLLDRMKIIQPYTQWIRSFGSTDGLEHSGAVAHSLGLKAALSAWISSDLNANETQITNLIAAAKRGEADLLIVGSEVLLRGDISESKLIDYINRVKQAVPGIPVTTSDVYSEIISHPNLRDVCDVLFVNLYPYWEGISIDSAIAFLDDRYKQVKEVADSKLVVVSETGWPSAGNPVGNAVPTPQNASRYFLDFILWAQRNNVYYLYFEAFDQTWKADAEGPQGANWGVWDKNGNLKPGMNVVFSGTECLFNWAEINYPALFAPAGPPTEVWSVYTYRYYPATNNYLGISSIDDHVYYMGPDGNLQDEGPKSDWMLKAGCQATIQFTNVPAYGSSDNLQGSVLGVDPANYGVVVYIKVGSGWWIKPFLDAPLTTIASNGTWIADITTGGSDQNATEIAAFLLPTTVSPPLLLGTAELPIELDNYPKVIATRSP